ncbi:Pentafunctional AROM polypeptide [Grifola frondosa]|uniref:Pentafunctional AROM polypeptide n=1 Tax=Grifola frondosa TaxID=5627 RepID=A0A1C7MKX1_GRIFR|nr:Pentafunctional AROM polypeptide [Grifola frondosa]
MAFSVLGTVVRDTIIEEKRCVEKTWPNWWDDLENKIGLQVEGVQLPDFNGLASVSRPTDDQSNSSVVIIGMRGSGKTFIGELAADALDWHFTDADTVFEEKHQMGVREFVQKNGWPASALRKQAPARSSAISRRVMSLALVEGQLFTQREINEVVKYLGEETARPAYGEPVVDVFQRREPCAISPVSFRPVGHVPPNSIREEVGRFFNHITGRRPNLAPNLARNKRSYFLSLTYPDIALALPYMQDLTAGVDAIELRVDLLRSPKDFDKFGPYIPPMAYVIEQLAALRQTTSLPIVFTVRQLPKADYSPITQRRRLFELFHTAARLAVEYIDVEVSWAERNIEELVTRKGIRRS